jgi:hypothetical protein
LGLIWAGAVGNGGAAAVETGAFDFALGGSGGGTKRVACAGLLGGGGINGLATGGRGGACAPVGRRGAAIEDRLVGKVIRTVSRPSAGFVASGGVTAMRTVSFFGSVGSAIRRCESAKRLPENHAPVTP